MSKGDIFPPNRPTPTSRGTTEFYDREENPEEDNKYPDYLRCLQCGFINKESNSNCAFCGAENWKGQHD